MAVPCFHVQEDEWLSRCVKASLQSESRSDGPICDLLKNVAGDKDAVVIDVLKAAEDAESVEAMESAASQLATDCAGELTDIVNACTEALQTGIREALTGKLDPEKPTYSKQTQKSVPRKHTAFHDELVSLKDSEAVPDYNNMKTTLDLEAASSYPDRAACGGNRSLPVYDCITEGIGKTPILRLHRLEQLHGLKGVELFGKVECMSAGGSVKDRIGRRMIERAEEKGLLKKGDYVVEATSGNTGIGLALMCAVKGYKMVVIMPQKMSSEKENTLRALGTEIIRTPNSAKWNDPNSHIAVAYRLSHALNKVSSINGNRHAYCLDQYQNRGNLEAHYRETANEILEQMENRLDYFVAAAGTGGTFTGTSIRLKEVLPNVRCIAVDPSGSILHLPLSSDAKMGNKLCASKDVKPYEVEGIGYDFHPATWNPKVMDGYELTDDLETFKAARDVIAHEGLMVGGSSGSAIAASLRIAKRMSDNLENLPAQPTRIVIMLPDGIRNYLSKFVSDDWMLSHSIFQKPSEHYFYSRANPDQLGYVAEQHPPTVNALKVSSERTLDDVYAELQNTANCQNVNGHAAVVCADTLGLLAVLSRTQVEYELLNNQSNSRMREFSSSSALYFFDPTESSDVSRDIQCILRSQYQEGKIHYPGVIIVTPQIRMAREQAWRGVGSTGSDKLSGFESLTLAEKRTVYCNLNWRDLDIELVTPQSFLKNHLKQC